MEPKYIVAIVALSLFCVLFLIFIVLLARHRRMEAKLQAWLHEVYADKNLIKMDYDTAAQEEETAQPVDRSAFQTAEQSTQENTEVKEEAQPNTEELYSKIDVEGIEEITGNYKPQ